MATVAEFAFQRSAWYALIYCACVLLVLETNIFMLWQEGVDWPTVRGAITYAAIITSAALYGASHVESWIVLVEGFMLAAVGLALLQTRHAVIGTLTLAMAWYDLMWLMSDTVRETNGWMPSAMCSAAFLFYAGTRERVSRAEMA